MSDDLLDRRIAAYAGRRFNRFSYREAEALGATRRQIEHRVACGRWVARREGVFAIAPVLEDPWGAWMELTLTAPQTFVSRFSAANSWQLLDREPPTPTVVRPGNGGPVVKDGFWVYRSLTLAGYTTTNRGIPITTPERTLIDIAGLVGRRTLSRAAREAIRLELCTVASVLEAVRRHPRRKGTRLLRAVLASYAGLPLERARSASEVRAMELLRDAGLKLPRLNRMVAGIEADLSWSEERVIIEIDGEQFHLDRGRDEEIQRVWERAGWKVSRLDARVVWEAPERLLGLAPG